MHNSKKVLTPQEATVDMNPMLDVVFILLIFFIVTASFNRETALELNRVDNTISTIQPKISPLFTINKQNQVYLNTRLITLENINVNIARLAAVGEINSISLRAHPLSEHNTLVAVLNAIKEQTDVPVSLGETLH
ncbi:biopolymer transporter [Pseudoalteromonas sp. MSK9-3]|uniref:ExbD/TolR family protein n=1 Tax=Pseudoalteromonas sp. MSK9-3 TaxID=1897633 RepID=UPI000E6BA57C|nr:biopolymer transporter ExbD [Pseudoalteromonas sp. MSK9-3]RJE77701.1 biopolymer transporter [Pseudoalteromonas sp. MSK9-3]